MNLDLFGSDLFGQPVAAPAHGSLLAEDFLLPPYSVLNAREGWWQERKSAWLRMGIQSEVGRAAGLLSENRMGYDWLERHPDADGIKRRQQGSSIFDPVLCELAYRWFCPPAGLVLDNFAGGSVRGIVAAALGRRYYGIELRPEQIASNEEQASAICNGTRPRWRLGDARNMAAYPGERADLLFTCPPYGDLERYSDDARDLSTMTWDQFRGGWGCAIERGAERLKPDRFAVFVVGNYRAPDGGYRDLVGETVRRAEAAGLRYYNEAVLVTPAGSLPIRIRKQFEAGRKLGKTHQNVLVFVKGDWRRAAEACRA